MDRYQCGKEQNVFFCIRTDTLYQHTQYLLLVVLIKTRALYVLAKNIFKYILYNILQKLYIKRQYLTIFPTAVQAVGILLSMSSSKNSF